MLCDVNICILIQDNNAQKVVHYSSNKKTSILDYFNYAQSRQFYSNADYEGFGGRAIEEEGGSDAEENRTGNIGKQVIRRLKKTSIAKRLKD